MVRIIKEDDETSGVMDLFIVLITVIVSQVYHIVPFKYMQFTTLPINLQKNLKIKLKF